MSIRLPSAAATVGITLATAVAVGAAFVPANAAAPTTGTVGRATQVSCVGTSTSCTATVSLAGGASNEKIAINLPAKGLRLVSAKPTNSNLDGSYLVSNQASKAGGRQYTFTLSAAEAPKGSALKFTFRKPGAAAPQILLCTGAMSCSVKAPLGGGASNRHVVVQLPRTDLGLISVKPNSSVLNGAYSISDQRLRKGHSEYEFVLNAVKSIPAGSYLTLTFAAAGA